MSNDPAFLDATNYYAMKISSSYTKVNPISNELEIHKYTTTAGSTTHKIVTKTASFNQDYIVYNQKAEIITDHKNTLDEIV